jgi:hypothetical protein
MRSGLVVLGAVLGFGLTAAACSPSAPRGPTWPRAKAHEVDGGESLAPRAAARAIAAVAEDDKPDRAADKPAATPATPAPADKPAAAAPAAPASDDPVMTEEIVIEVEDKD